MENLISDINLVDSVNISLMSVILSLVFAGASGYAVKILYLKFGRSMNNRAIFSDTFVMLAITTSIIIVIVKYSLALSLGLVGALSIVRFRAAIKEPEELVYLFLVIALGLCFGANQYLPGFLLLVAASLASIITNQSRNNKTINASGYLLLIEGESFAVEDWMNKNLQQLKNLSDFINFKEIEISNNKTRYLLRIHNINKEEQFLKFVSHPSDNISINFISDVTIPE